LSILCLWWLLLNISSLHLWWHISLLWLILSSLIWIILILSLSWVLSSLVLILALISTSSWELIEVWIILLGSSKVVSKLHLAIRRKHSHHWIGEWLLWKKLLKCLRLCDYRRINSSRPFCAFHLFEFTHLIFCEQNIDEREIIEKVHKSLVFIVISQKVFGTFVLNEID